MIIGVPKEVKKEEYRVALTPAGTAELVTSGNEVLVETGAGEGSGFTDDCYLKSGGRVVAREELFRRAELIVKVKEPLQPEFGLFREGQALFTYLHLAPARDLTEFLMARKITALAYETLERDGALPLLAPMSEVAGRMAPLVAAWCMQRIMGGGGLLPTGAVGVRPAKAVILGAGTVGFQAARVAVGIGMETVVLNRGVERLQRVDELMGGRVRTGILATENIREELRAADLVVGAVLVPGGRTPVLITRGMLGEMKKGAVIVDVAVDQGGCAETTRPTTHDDPVYLVDGIVHYAVANMPGAYPRTSTLALTNATLPYVKFLAGRGVDRAIAEDPSLATAVNVKDGRIVHPALAASMGSI
ncbi:alanine dehydrogenase [Geotalea uraniireducens]|uniref:Alanine dehydrogenase n=1 Tax=Geotalea uraniireducens (strain Rf4) TaxID=351605 RepID=A5GEE8_GEOUR|nr:alanine dehydrogenase [Geotalea uraniireducens]ABQ25803.1 L-alanine dehydrogenase [Geotalea uraniireducens Rf4]